MDLQDKIKIWIKQQLALMGHGSKKKFADFMGLTPTKVTRMLNTDVGKEHRIIRADEYIKIAEFFKKMPADLVPSFASDEGKKQLIAIYESVSPELQNAILVMVRALAEEKNKK